MNYFLQHLKLEEERRKAECKAQLEADERRAVHMQTEGRWWIESMDRFGTAELVKEDEPAVRMRVVLGRLTIRAIARLTDWTLPRPGTIRLRRFKEKRGFYIWKAEKM